MVFTSFEIDDKLFHEAWSLSGISKKKEMIAEVLRVYVRLHEQAGIRSLRISTRSGGSAVQVLVDSSVWIDYFTGAATPETDHLDSLLGRSPLAVADVVMTEVLHGLPDEAHRKLAREALGRLWLVEMGGFDLADQAAVNYHTLRARGLPVRTAECRLATFCIRSGFALLHASPGFEPFERHLGLTVARAAAPAPGQGFSGAA